MTSSPSTIQQHPAGTEHLRSSSKSARAAALQAYTQALEPTRQRFERGQFATLVLGSELGEDEMELFLIHYCSLGVAMTEPVEDWIRRAGEACTAMGLHELGAALIKHAKQESGHHELMIRDTQALVAHRRHRGISTAEADTLIARPPGAAVKRYHDLHEDAIAGSQPYVQIAIEYEIERLAVVYGPRLIDRCKELLGPEITPGLSFLIEHAELDVGHTKFNEARLSRLLERHPDFLGPLVDSGSNALDAYGDFFDHCIACTRADHHS